MLLSSTIFIFNKFTMALHSSVLKEYHSLHKKY